MYKAVALQIVCALLGVACGAAAYGSVGALSAAAAGVACVIPNALFVRFLQRSVSCRNELQGLLFFLGEFAKIILVVLILLIIAWLFPGVNWGAVVIGLIVTLQANFLVFLVKP